MIYCRSLIAASILALSLGILGCGDDDRDTSPTPTASPTAAPLSLTEWARQACAFAVQAADTENIPGPQDPSTLSFEERKQRAADVLAPRADALAETAQAIAALHPPESAAAFHGVFHMTMSDVAAAWHTLVDTAAQAQTAAELDGANEVYIQAQASADARVITAYDALANEVTAALATPVDCGVLNDVRS